MARYTVTMGHELAKRFEAAAAESGITLAEAMRRALRLYVTAVQSNARVHLVLPRTSAVEEYDPVVEVTLR